jgi:aromatic-L-amino-acid decarboxylase
VEVHEATFNVTPSYLRDEGRGVIAGGIPFANRGVELTRSFKALKVWLSLKAEGVERFGRIVEQNVMQAQEFTTRIAQVKDVEIMAPTALNIVCWRVTRPGLTPEQQDTFNKELLLRIQEQGLAIPSGSQIHGRYIIRVACSNHRTRWEDLERLAVGVERISGEITATA